MRPEVHLEATCLQKEARLVEELEVMMVQLALLLMTLQTMIVQRDVLA